LAKYDGQWIVPVNPRELMESKLVWRKNERKFRHGILSPRDSSLQEINLDKAANVQCSEKASNSHEVTG